VTKRTDCEKETGIALYYIVLYYYCTGCDSGVGKILKTLVMLQKKHGRLEERQGKLEKEVRDIKMQKDRAELEKD
jgi:hypothetical protein